jgi:hypothetical protein
MRIVITKKVERQSPQIRDRAGCDRNPDPKPGGNCSDGSLTAAFLKDLPRRMEQQSEQERDEEDHRYDLKEIEKTVRVLGNMPCPSREDQEDRACPAHRIHKPIRQDTAEPASPSIRATGYSAAFA